MKRTYRKVRKAFINTFDPIRQQWISDEFKDQYTYNEWIEKWTLRHNKELRLLRKMIDDEKKNNQELREDLDAIKGMFPNFFPTQEKEDPEESEIAEQKEKIELIPSESLEQEPTVDDTEKERSVSEKEKKRGFFAKLFKKKAADSVDKGEEKKGFLARLFEKKPTK